MKLSSPVLPRCLLLWIMCAALLGACGTRAPLATKQVTQAAAEQSVVPGHSNKAEVLAALGPTTKQVFSSGYEVWLYSYPPAGRRSLLRGRSEAENVEFVVLFGPDGIVKKTRHRDPPQP